MSTASNGSSIQQQPATSMTLPATARTLNVFRKYAYCLTLQPTIYITDNVAAVWPDLVLFNTEGDANPLEVSTIFKEYADGLASDNSPHSHLCLIISRTLLRCTDPVMVLLKQCHLESVASYLCRFMLTCDIPTTHNNDAGHRV